MGPDEQQSTGPKDRRGEIKSSEQKGPRMKKKGDNERRGRAVILT